MAYDPWPFLAPCLHIVVFGGNLFTVGLLLQGFMGGLKIGKFL